MKVHELLGRKQTSCMAGVEASSQRMVPWGSPQGHKSEVGQSPSAHLYEVPAAAAAAAAPKSLQSYPTLYDPIDGSPPGSAIPGILQARTLEWVPRIVKFIELESTLVDARD